MQETQLLSLGREDALEKEMAPNPVFLLGKSQQNPIDRGAWQVAINRVTQSRIQLND